VIVRSHLEQPQNHWQQEMTRKLIPHRQHNREVVDPPAGWCIRAEVDHHAGEQEDDDVHVLEVFDDLVHADEEACLLELLARRRPFHVDAEEMAADGFGEVDGEAAEEDHCNVLDRLGVGGQRWDILKKGIHLRVVSIPLKKLVLPRRWRRKLYAIGDWFRVITAVKKIEGYWGETHD